MPAEPRAAKAVEVDCADREGKRWGEEGKGRCTEEAGAATERRERRGERRARGVEGEKGAGWR